jgi:hypothetical protein
MYELDVALFEKLGYVSGASVVKGAPFQLTIKHFAPELT